MAKEPLTRPMGADDLIAAPRAPKRAVHYYSFPEAVVADPAAGTNGITAIGLVALEPREELMAAARAGNAPGAMTEKQCTEALRAIVREGTTESVSTEDGTAEAAWSRLGPKGRALLVSAFNDLHGVTTALEASFLRSRTTRAG